MWDQDWAFEQTLVTLGRGAAARRAGYLGNDGGHDLVRGAADKIAAGQTLVIFPEGHISRTNDRLGTLMEGVPVRLESWVKGTRRRLTCACWCTC